MSMITHHEIMGRSRRVQSLKDTKKQANMLLVLGQWRALYTVGRGRAITFPQGTIHCTAPEHNDRQAINI